MSVACAATSERKAATAYRTLGCEDGGRQTAGRDALLGLEEEAWRDDALAMIYDTDTSQAAKLHHLCWSFAALLHWLEQSGPLCISVKQVCSCFAEC